MKKFFLLILLIIFVSVANAEATLIDRGGGLIYDTDRNITWLQDANYAQTTGYVSLLYPANIDGRMYWADAKQWAENLVYYDPVRNVTYDNWRLPLNVQPDPTCSDQYMNISYGTNCMGSELGHLYYIESDYLGLFTNLQTGYPGYWFLLPDYNEYNAWIFTFNSGTPSPEDKSLKNFAWAVRDGDVASVPEPATLLLMSIGLIGMLMVVTLKGFRFFNFLNKGAL